MAVLTIDDEIAEQERELNLRRLHYPERTKGPNPKLKPDIAAHRIACLERTIERLKIEKSRAAGEQGTLFN